MGARTGKEFLEGLRDTRCVWVGNERVEDVTAHPTFAGPARTMAEIYDLQHDAADVCLMEDPETGEPVSVSHLIPRSKGDLTRRHACFEVIASHTAGLMGRTPDYLNATFAGFAGRCDEWAQNGNERGAANLVAYQREMARRDLCLTHTIVHPTTDKSLGDAPSAGNDVALKKVGETSRGIVVRGARILATLAPFADEIAVYPGHPLPEGADAFALAFAIPVATPGLKFLCRDSTTTGDNVFDRPISSRFDEQDAFVIFDDVEVPRDRLFIDCNLPLYNAVMTTGWMPNVLQQTTIRAQVKLAFAHELAARIAEAINDTKPATLEMLGEIATYAELARSAVVAGEAGAFDYGNGVWFCDGAPLFATRAALPTWFPRVNEIIRLVGSHNLLAAPTAAQLAAPELRPLVDHYLRGAKGTAAEERIRLFRLAWDFTGSALASRNEQYERFYLASAARNYMFAHMLANRRQGALLVDRLMKQRGAENG